MKKLLILLLLPFAANSQRLGVGLSTGYSSLKTITCELYVGYAVSKKVTIYPVSLKVFAQNTPSTPVIFESRVSYWVGSFECYGGAAYHISGMDQNKCYKQYQGLRPAYGVVKHFRKVVVSAQASGDIYSLNIGIFSFK